MSLFGKDDAIALYRESFQDTWPEGTPAQNVRFVVLDTETTGLNPKKDAIVTIGAVAVQDGAICLDDQFEALLRFRYNTSSVVVHGITREIAAEEGVDEVEALRDFLGYLRDGIIVGHHIGFDVEILKEHCKRNFGVELENRWLDTMELTLHLEDSGAFGPPPGVEAEEDERGRDLSLDGLCARFDIKPHDRHTASGDAFITAQVFLKLLLLARRHGRRTLGTLCQRWIDPRNVQAKP